MTAALDGAIGAMPAAERRRYEAALADAAREDLAAAMRASVGPHGTMARDGQGSADMARRLGTGNLRRVAAQLTSDATAERKRNIGDLTRIIYHEVQGVPAAGAAVGWVVMKRMRRNGTAAVAEVAGGFARSTIEPDMTKSDNIAIGKIATLILDGKIPDPAQGATHFYTPRMMPKEGQPVGKSDVGGGLESVPGVKDALGRPIRNYRPGWPDSRLPSGNPAFIEVAVPGVPAASFKFFRAAEGGHVR
ncbi:MAG: cell wall hydrolase [Alphaproteobacteria bacterium]|nr:cell wall hydrolase [Alphaproteobacteria bacterium]